MPANGIAMKLCAHCGVIQELTPAYFQPNRRMANGFDSWCRECRRRAAKLRMRAKRLDPTQAVKILDQKRRHAKSPKGHESKRKSSLIWNHKRRQRGLPVAWNWTAKMWQRCKAAWGGACAYCGKTGVVLMHDHFIPLASPDCPGTVPSNIVPACASCNGLKHVKDPFKWCKDRHRLAAIVDYLRSTKAFAPG
jgi:5-methylcytosine-specific restriction endonuclease McrA